MSTNYNGVPDNVIPSGPVGITSSTFANPIQITAPGHGMTSGDHADVYLHQANTPANGLWTVTVIDANNFTIPVAGITGGGATGYVQPLRDGSVAPTPSDGDDEDAASVDVMLQALADRTSHLFVSTGGYKLATRLEMSAGAATGSFSSAVWAKGTDSTGLAATVMTNGSSGSLSWPTLAAIAAGDIILVDLDTTASLLSGAGAYVELWGATPSPGTIASFEKMAGVSRSLSSAGGVLFGAEIPMHLKGNLVAGNAGLFVFELMMAGFSGGGQVTLVGDFHLSIEVWRATGVPQ